MIATEDRRDPTRDRRVTNAAGVTFDLRVHVAAPGAIAAGPTTDEHSWFPGHTWQRAFCRGCSCHVGWLFRSPTAVFTALIADRVG